MYRRIMYSVAERIAHIEGARAIVTGESLGQVASQTLENIMAVNEAVKIPVFRPLIGSDKQEIIARAEEIGTFDISTEAAPDCCTLFMPRRPETHAKLDAVHEAWELFDHEEMIERLLKQTEYIDFESNTYKAPKTLKRKHSELAPREIYQDDTMVLGGFAMAQREQHERVKKMDRWAGKLLGHKAVVMAILVVIAMASGLAMANLGGGAGGVSFERTDGSGTLVVPGSGDASSGKTSEGSSPKASAAAEVYVDVDGAVVSPGVYRLKDGARVAQAIDAAGGLAPEADVTGLNRASKVTDGQKIHVPTVGEQQVSIAEAGVDGGASASSGVGGATGLVNINTASSAELQTLSGIGPSMAQSIIDERTKNGAFASVDDLMRVSGIGEKKLAKIKDCICV